MYPILFEIPLIGVPLRAFGLMVVLGFLVGTHLYGKLGDRYAVDREADAPGFAAVPMWILVGILLGGQGHVRHRRDLPRQRHRTALPR